MTNHSRARVCLFASVVLARLLWADPSAGIPVFARIYDKPCGACHTTYPQLNPAGENFRLNGLHGMTPKIEPLLRLGPWFELPGTFPFALAMAVGDDISKVSRPGSPEDLQEHANLEFLSILAGGELGQHLAFLADYQPLRHDTRTGSLEVSTNLGMAVLQAHAATRGWLFNLKGGLFELPFSVSPRVHRLSVQSYQTYGLTAFSLLGRRLPPNNGARQETLALNSTQFGAEISAFQSETGHTVALGLAAGSNNRTDNNSSKDVYVRIGRVLGFHRAGMLVYYSPDILGRGAVDSALRFGPDVTLYYRRLTVLSQFLAARDSNPTTYGEDMWWYGGFVEADYRLTPTLVALFRPELTGMPTFDDTDHGGTTRIRRHLWQVTAGLQWLVLENLKLIAEGTYGENNEAVAGKTTESYAMTVRAHTSFWPLTPPGLEWLRSRTR
jgi:hypothetical protein